jgi:hypothetical protein
VAWVAFLEGAARSDEARVHVVRWTGTGWTDDAEWTGASARSRVWLANLASGALWLAWTALDPGGSRVEIARRTSSGWTLSDELPSPAADAEASFVCADASGDPLIALTSAGGGMLLHRRR